MNNGKRGPTGGPDRVRGSTGPTPGHGVQGSPGLTPGLGPTLSPEAIEFGRWLYETFNPHARRDR